MDKPQVDVGATGTKPDRKMRAAGALLKNDLQEGKKLLKIVDQLVLKLPGADSHKFHGTEGEVHYAIFL